MREAAVGPPSLRLAAMGRLPSLRLLLVLGLACGRVAGLGAAVAGQARADGCTRRVPLRMHFVRPCGYTRGADDGSVVDEALVERMLSERSLLRHEKRFYEADALRDRLNEMGVWIYDRERRWVCANNFPRVAGTARRKEVPARQQASIEAIHACLGTARSRQARQRALRGRMSFDESWRGVSRTNGVMSTSVRSVIRRQWTAPRCSA